MPDVITISLDRTLRDRLDEYCTLADCNRSEVARRALIFWMNAHPMETPKMQTADNARAKGEAPPKKPPEPKQEKKEGFDLEAIIGGSTS